MIHRSAAVASQHAEECASSIIMMGAVLLGQVAQRGSGPISPSMEKTPSVMISLCPGSPAISFNSSSACIVSLWRKTLIFARESLAPSMMLAWFSSSEMMKSSLPRMAVNRPCVGRKA